MCQSGVGPSYHPPYPPLPPLTLKDFVLCVQLPVCCARFWLCTLVARLVHGYALRRSSVGPAARCANVPGLESKPSRSASTVAYVLDKLSLKLKGAALWALPRLSMCERGGGYVASSAVQRPPALSRTRHIPLTGECQAVEIFAINSAEGTTCSGRPTPPGFHSRRPSTVWCSGQFPHWPPNQPTALVFADLRTSIQA